MKNYISSFLLVLFTLASCNNDGDLFSISSVTDNELIASNQAVVLSNANNTSVVLSFAWDVNKLVGSSSEVLASEPAMTLEMSDDETFDANVIRLEVVNNSKAFIGGELNTLANTLGLINDEVNASYFRLAAASGSNIAPTYSETIKVDITPYKIDYTKGHLVRSNVETGVMESTGEWLSSPNETGVYTGFIGAAAWYGFYLQEGDGTVWGNDGVSGTPFILSSSTKKDEKWNCWFPSVAGSYFVEFDTNKKQWTASNITKLEATGDLSGSLVFNRNENTWTLVGVTVESGTTYQLQLKGETAIYNQNSGDSETSNFGTIYFAQEGDMVVKANQVSNISVVATQSGELSLVLNLNRPDQLTLSLTEGTEQPIKIPELLYLPGVDDGISGGWNFNNYISLTNNDDEQFYTGVLNVNSLWGYNFSPIKDDWDTKYTSAGGDAYGGTLELAGATNIPAPTAGLYLYQVSTSAMTYNLTALGNEIYVQGIDDKWEWNTELVQTATPGVYEGVVSFTGNLPWGMKIMLVKDNWDLAYGCSNGKLNFGANGVTNDPNLRGDYVITVNLIEGIYSINAE